MKKYIKTYSEFLNEYLSTEGGYLMQYFIMTDEEKITSLR